MTTIAVLAEPPRAGTVLPDLVDSTPLTEAEAAELSAAMLRDVCRSVEESGGDLLVNYRSADDVEGFDADEDVAAYLRETLAPALEDAEAARYEVQVGSTPSARAGNTITHLLEQESVASAAVVDPTAAMLGRRHVDNAAMKLRRQDVVLGPADDGRVYYAGFCEPVDFEDAFTAPTVGTLTERGVDEGLEVDYLPMLPVVETAADLAGLVSQVYAREVAGRIRPDHTTAFLLEAGIDVVEDGDGLAIVRE